jgi:hypothetical protein
VDLGLVCPTAPERARTIIDAQLDPLVAKLCRILLVVVVGSWWWLVVVVVVTVGGGDGVGGGLTAGWDDEEARLTCTTCSPVGRYLSIQALKANGWVIA